LSLRKDRPTSIVIVSPALADANNGNWQTARRWQRLLAPHRARIVREWPDDEADRDQLMLALHARRSAAAIAAWHRARGSQGLGLLLTGTDLYRDLPAGDPDAHRSLSLAGSIAVLQPLALRSVPLPERDRTRVIMASCRARRAIAKTSRHLRVLMVGHLRDEKDPLTLMAAAGALAQSEGIPIDHIGAALDPALGEAAQRTASQYPHYRWLGALPHPRALERIQRAHLLVHASRMEGGAHAVMEAICCGTPVICSAIEGNLGLLCEDYPGRFEIGDAGGLAALLRRCRAAQLSGQPGLLADLERRCRLLRAQFEPAAERNALQRWVADLLQAGNT
jgi:putative glycosyltransferase (TIGR04348 family)